MRPQMLAFFAAVTLGVMSFAEAQEMPQPATETAQSTPAPETAAPNLEASAPAAALALPAGIGAPPEGRGQIVFFRPNRFVGMALSFTVRENEQDLGRLPNARYFVHVAEPGIHAYEIGRNDTMRMEIEPDETYYVIQSTHMGIVAGRAVLSPSDQAAFEEALPRMRLWAPRN